MIPALEAGAALWNELFILI